MSESSLSLSAESPISLHGMRLETIPESTPSGGSGGLGLSCSDRIATVFPSCDRRVLHAPSVQHRDYRVFYGLLSVCGMLALAG